MKNRFIAMLMLCMLLLSCMPWIPAQAEGGYAANLGFADAGWQIQEWGNRVHTEIHGAGEYRLSFDASVDATAVLFIEIAGAFSYFEAQDLGLTALQILVDGVPIPVDLSKVITGDPDDNGNYRIEIYNAYELTGEDPPVDPTRLSFSENLTICFTVGPLHTEPVPPPPPPPVFDPMAAYKAHLMLQTDQDPYSVAEISLSGNGNYSLAAIDLTAAPLKRIYVLTSIPETEAVAITDVRLMLDDQVFYAVDHGMIGYTEDHFLQILIPEHVAEWIQLEDRRLEISFTVSGFAYNLPTEEEPIPTQTDPTVPAEAPTEPAPEEHRWVIPWVLLGLIALAVIAFVSIAIMQKKLPRSKR